MRLYWLVFDDCACRGNFARKEEVEAVEKRGRDRFYIKMYTQGYHYIRRAMESELQVVHCNGVFNLSGYSRRNACKL